MRLLLAAVIASAVVGCKAPELPRREDPTVLIPVSDSAPGPDGVSLAPPPSPPTEPLEVKLEMKKVQFTEGRMSLAIIDAPHATRAWDRGGVLLQTVPLSEDAALRIVVRAGVGESLDGFRRDHDDDDLSDLGSTTICAKPAARLEARAPEQHITCVIYADGRPNSPAYIPAETSIVTAFDHRGLGVTAEWEIPTELRGRYRDLEEQFFASFRCH